jgi:hypothetical protein
MDQPATRRNATTGALPIGLVGALLAAAAFELWLSTRRHEFTPMLPAAFHYAYDRAGQVQGHKVLLFGDSQVKHGIDPRAISQTHGPTFNLACNGARPIVSWALLKRALDAGARPDAVVVDFQTTLLQQDPTNDVAGLAEVLSVPDAWRLAHRARQPVLFAQLMAHRLPSLSGRDRLRGAACDLLSGRRLVPEGKGCLAAYQAWDAQDGANLWEQPHPRLEDGRFFDEAQAEFFGEWFCHPLNAVYVNDFLRLAESRGIPVYWVAFPTRQRLREWSDRLGNTGKLTTMLRSAAARYPNLTVVDARDIGYADDLFMDGGHLLRPGSERLSRRLADLIAARGEPVDASGPRYERLSPSTADAAETPALADRPGAGLRR